MPPELIRQGNDVCSGTVPASYVGSEDPGVERKPEDAADDTGAWDYGV